MNFKEKKNNI